MSMVVLVFVLLFGSGMWTQEEDEEDKCECEYGEYVRQVLAQHCKQTRSTTALACQPRWNRILTHVGHRSLSLD